MTKNFFYQIRKFLIIFFDMQENIFIIVYQRIVYYILSNLNYFTGLLNLKIIFFVILLFFTFSSKDLKYNSCSCFIVLQKETQMVLFILGKRNQICKMEQLCLKFNGISPSFVSILNGSHHLFIPQWNWTASLCWFLLRRRFSQYLFHLRGSWSHFFLMSLQVTPNIHFELLHRFLVHYPHFSVV